VSGLARSAGTRRSRAAAVLIVALVLSFLSYLPALRGGFVSDDGVLIAGNPAVRSLSGAFDSFGRSYWHGLKSVAPYYRPLVVLSYAIDHAAAGLKPAYYHATNIALHALCSFLAGLLVMGLAARAGTSGSADFGGDGAARLAGAPASGTESRGGVAVAGALLAAALVAAHPLHSEAAAAIYGRPDLLAALFSLGFLNLAIRRHWSFALACLAAALFSKESAMGIPLLAPFACAVGKREAFGSAHARAQRGAVFLFTLAALAVLGGYLLARHNALGGFFDESAVTRLDNPLVDGSPLERRLTPVAVLGDYAALWAWPQSLCADRGYDTTGVIGSASNTEFLRGAAILLAAGALVASLTLRRSVWAIPAAGAVLAYAPASSLILTAPALMAERFAYLPSVFVCVLFGAVYARLGGGSMTPPHVYPAAIVPKPGQANAEARTKTPPAVAGWPFGRLGLHAAAIVVVTAAGARTFARAADFRDDLSLHRATVLSCPRSAKAQYNLGNALQRLQRDDEAVVAFQSAVAIAPWLAFAHNNLGSSYLNLRRLPEAEAAYRRAVEEGPSLFNTRANLAMVLYIQGKLEPALDQARAAVELSPTPADAEQIGELVKRIDRRLRPEAP